MNQYFVAVCIAAILSQIEAFTLQQRQQGDLFALECLRETAANPVSVALLKIGDFSARDEASKCFVRCFFEKEGFMDARGNVETENIVAALSNDYDKVKVEALIDRCQVEGREACDTAFQMYECFYRNRESL
ncbi:odorant-binding protein [Culex quinquefasciatus]|uniref:Odorant-binding protein n=1 Tax=Culex quinquefasciatus TaxID=7176 RepID=B0X0G5_CULQU|nr:general odorant-binding protein 56d [Culex quinquefasciatus]EDS38126.1 odorant-binding protein [Culex quinquefasciatus]|eukprot:XP_001863137.1 odorant-binding protein [Culex quinquefasciatus]